MLNKLKFNNLIISNKTAIQKARVQTIQKLVRKLRKLSVPKEESASKTQVKERRITVCMEHLKKLKCLEIVQNVLLFEKNPAAVLANEQSLPEEVVTAMLAVNKVMAKLITRFKHELNLKNGTSAKWRDEILATSRRREKFDRTDQKRQKRKELKEQKTLTRKREEWIQENQTHEELSATLSSENSGDLKDEALSETVITKEAKQPKAKQNKKEKVSKNIKLNDITKPTSDKKRKTFEKPVDDTTLAESKHKQPKQEIALEVDSFFITESGENYLSTAGNLIANGEDEKEGEALTKRTTGKKTTMRTVEPRSHQRTKKPHVNDLSPQTNDSKTQVNTENLHPSWAAKQKLKPVITAFQGKKITFEADDD